MGIDYNTFITYLTLVILNTNSIPSPQYEFNVYNQSITLTASLSSSTGFTKFYPNTSIFFAGLRSFQYVATDVAGTNFFNFTYTTPSNNTNSSNMRKTNLFNNLHFSILIINCKGCPNLSYPYYRFNTTNSTYECY